MDFMEALARASSEHDERKDEPKLNDVQKEAQIMELCAFYERCQQECPFKPGDLVTPIKGRTVKGAGRPHIVTEVPSPQDRPPRFVAEDASAWASQAYGARIDMRVASIMRGREEDCLVQHWTESVNYELWTEADADA